MSLHFYKWKLFLFQKFIFLILFVLLVKGRYDEYIFSIKNNTIKYSNDFYVDEADKKKALRKGKKYFYTCKEDILIKKQGFKKNDYPLISVVIPVYNAEFKIKKAVRSIQNQNLSFLEIILVNDYSTDKTLDIIKSLQKEDFRIILIENKENKGILYSRCIGTLEAKGKYIFPLDNDDLFFDEDVISTIVNEAIKGEYDIVEFNYAEYYDLNFAPNKFISTEFGNHTHNLIINQPELSQFPRKKNNSYGVYDCFLWAKCINTKIYQESINKLGFHIYSKYILRGEDFIMTFILFRIANSFKFIGKYGIFRYKSIKTATFQSSVELYLLSRIIYLDVILKFTKKNHEDKLYVVYFSESFFQEIKKDLNNMKNENKIYFKKVFHKLINNKYINKKHKNKFISFFNNYTWILN